MLEKNNCHRRTKFNHSNALPRYIISFDAETLPDQTDISGRKFTHRFRLATATCGRLRGTEISEVKRYRFTSTDEFWAWLVSMTASNYTTWLVSHNALFDMIICGFMQRFETGEITIDWPRSKRKREDNNEDNTFASGLCVIESPPTIIASRIGITQGRLVIIDSLNWFPVSLRSLGESIGLEKMPMPDFLEPDSAWFPYCQRDSDILFETFTQLIKWVKSNDMGMFRYTAPSQAMSAYRHRFMKSNIYTHSNLVVKQLERDGYFGGRTEVFKMGEIKEQVYQLDVNALFPAVMRGGFYPCILHKSDMRTDYTSDLPDIKWESCVAEVLLETYESIFPCRSTFVTTYPIGRFYTVLCGKELEYAIKQNYVKKVCRWAEYRLADLFTLWVDELWELRQRYKTTGNNIYADFVKRIMNSLYGKFGQRPPKWENCPNDYSGLPWTTWPQYNDVTKLTEVFRMFGWQLQKKSRGGEIETSFVAIPAFVTSAARLHMNKLRTIAGRGNIYYQGVDGLIATQMGFYNLTVANEIQQSELGKLRLITSVNCGEIMGCSDYRLGDKVIIAGRSRPNDIAESAEILTRKFYSARSMFAGQAATSIDEEIQPWNRSQEYIKGVIGQDGWVKPFNLS